MAIRSGINMRAIIALVIAALLMLGVVSTTSIVSASHDSDYVHLTVELRGGDGSVLDSGKHWIGNINRAENPSDPCGNGTNQCFDGDELIVERGPDITFRYFGEGRDGTVRNSLLSNAGSFQSDGETLTAEFATVRFNYELLGGTQVSAHPATWTTFVQGYGTLGNPLVTGEGRNGEVVHLVPGSSYPVRPDVSGVTHSPALDRPSFVAGDNKVFTTQVEMSSSISSEPDASDPSVATVRFNYELLGGTRVSEHPATWFTRVQRSGFPEIIVGNPITPGEGRNGEVVDLQPGGYVIRPDVSGVTHSPALARPNFSGDHNYVFTTRVEISGSISSQ